MALVSVQLGYKDSAWFTANAALVLKAGQMVYLEQTGTYKIGDGTTVLSALTFLGGASPTGFVPYTGATANVDLGTYGITAEFGSFQYAQVYMPTFGNAATLLIKADDPTRFGQVSLVNEANTVDTTFQQFNSASVAGGIYVPNSAALRTNGVTLNVGNYGSGTVQFFTGSTVRATLSNAGTFEILTPKFGASSTTGYVWTATDAVGNGSWQAASGGSPSLPYREIAYGDATNQMTSDAGFTRNNTGGNDHVWAGGLGIGYFAHTYNGINATAYGEFKIESNVFNYIKINRVGIPWEFSSTFAMHFSNAGTTVMYLDTVNGNLKMHGDVETDGVGDGFISKSPDGTRWKIEVSNLGILSAVLA